MSSIPACHGFLNKEMLFFFSLSQRLNGVITAVWSSFSFSVSNLHMGDNILDLASVPCFVEANWIGLGKWYPTTNTPYEVYWAKQDSVLVLNNTHLTYSRKVIALCSQTGGKNGKHESVSDSSK